MIKGKRNKKLFKDSKLFSLISSVAPEVIDSATDIIATAVPAFSPINNLVDRAIGIANDKGEFKVADELIEERHTYLKELDSYYKDIESARSMYANTDNETADIIAMKIIKENLWILLLMVAIQVAVVVYVEGQVAAVITGVIGTITGALINERNTIVNFFFGSSKGLKIK